MTTYRLPEWLGGHEVNLLTATLDGPQLMRRSDGVGDDFRFEVERLVAAEPPSIDDPVELPLTLVDDVADRTVRLVPGDVTNYPAHLRLRLRAEHVDKDGQYYASAVFEPTAEQCRNLARALWLLGTREAS